MRLKPSRKAWANVRARLGQAWDSFEEDVASRAGDEQPIDERPLADEDPAHLRVERFQARPRLLDLAILRLNINGHELLARLSEAIAGASCQPLL